MGLFRFLVIAAVIYFGFRLVTRFLLPLFGQYVARKASEQVKEQMARQEQGKKIYQDEHITIRKNQRGGKKGEKGTDGEYVDYQEVD